ncbi:hypothetical protein OROMI_031873 [Orobanche minor]
MHWLRMEETYIAFVTRQVNLYVREAIFKEIIDTLSGIGRNSALGDRAIESLTVGILGCLMKVMRTGSTNTVIHHLIVRQLEGAQIPQMSHGSKFAVGPFIFNNYGHDQKPAHDVMTVGHDRCTRWLAIVCSHHVPKNF